MKEGQNNLLHYPEYLHKGSVMKIMLHIYIQYMYLLYYTYVPFFYIRNNKNINTGKDEQIVRFLLKGTVSRDFLYSVFPPK